MLIALYFFKLITDKLCRIKNFYCQLKICFTILSVNKQVKIKTKWRLKKKKLLYLSHHLIAFYTE